MRRRLLATLALPLALLVAPAWAAPDSAPGQSGKSVAGQPNVVVITVDDMRQDDLAYMPRTRALIGGQGVQFENSFAPYPLCCPARSSFLTGLYTHNHGVWSHKEPWGFHGLDDSNTLPVRLQRAGYDTAFLGKYLNGYGRQPAPDGSGDSSTYVPPGWTDWRGSLDGSGEGSTQRHGGTYRFFNTTLNDNGAFYREPGAYQSEVFGGLTEEIVAERSGDRPFFLWANYVAPHNGNPDEPDDPEPVTRTDGQVSRFATPARPGRVKGLFDSVITEAPGAEGEADVSDKPSFIRKQPPLNDAERQGLLEVTRQRAEALSVVDEQVERTVQALAASGELDNTLLFFTSDNGYFLGEHRIRQGKILPYDPALRVPLLVRGPGIPAGEVRHDPFTSLDFAPTILAAAGAPADPSLDGQRLLGVARHGDTGWRRGVLTESGPRDTVTALDESGPRLLARDPGQDARRYAQGVRTEQYLYVEHASGETELYDLHVDPDQLDNVAGDPAYAVDQRALAETLDRLRDCRGPSCREPLPQRLQAGP